MDSVNQTLYIPLYGKSYVSKKGLILKDTKAEEIWAAEGFPLKGKSKSKWLAYYMGMRSAVFDRWVVEKMDMVPEAVVIHLGCGMDSRILRAGDERHLWFDVDFPEVIGQRRRYYADTENYKMVASDVRDRLWMEDIPGNAAIVVMEGISMYLQPEELKAVLGNLCSCFDRVELLMDCYTTFAAKASRYKNPINDVGVTQVYGLDDPRELESENLRFCKAHEITPQDLIDHLQGVEKTVFQKLYAGKIADRMYKLYEFEGGNGR